MFDLGVPVLGICYGCQEIAWRDNAENVAPGEAREYGHTVCVPRRGSLGDLSSLERVNGANLTVKSLTIYQGDSDHINQLFAGLGDKMDGKPSSYNWLPIPQWIDGIQL